MRNMLVPILMVIGLLTAGGSASAQLCGDANSDSTVNIGDLVTIVDYISSSSPIQINLADADCDGRAGVTISDAVTMSRYFFEGGSLDCSAAGSYSFAPSATDTVFIPRMLNVPAYMDTVSLVVATSFDSTTGGLYLPMIAHGAGSNNLFTLNSVDAWMSSGPILGAGGPIGDTTVLWGSVLGVNEVSGYNEFFQLNYVRVAPGIGNIVPELVDRSSLWRTAVEKGGDLRVPLVFYNDAPLPQDTLIALPTELFFSAQTGQPTAEMYMVNFVSTGGPIAFDLVPTQPWIFLTNDSLPSRALVTPASIIVTVGSASLPEGVHFGQIEIVGVDTSVVKNTDAIGVTLTITTAHPPGDFNCDGQADIVDLMMYVSWLFLDGPPLVYCD